MRVHGQKRSWFGLVWFGLFGSNTSLSGTKDAWVARMEWETGTTVTGKRQGWYQAVDDEVVERSGDLHEACEALEGSVRVVLEVHGHAWNDVIHDVSAGVRADLGRHGFQGFCRAYPFPAWSTKLLMMRTRAKTTMMNPGMARS